MSEELLIHHCSPTLAGIKTGSLFSCVYHTKEQVRDTIRTLNQRLAAKGLRILPLRFTERTVLIYVYRPHKLQADLSQDLAADLLARHGYDSSRPALCLTRLAARLSGDEAFPHEIGLLLGYPPEDVCGFIENRAEGCKCVGCWKVYGDEAQARRTFSQYKRCTEHYRHQWANGTSLERLTVPS